jgi:hypothetical protein
MIDKSPTIIDIRIKYVSFVWMMNSVDELQVMGT